MQRLRLAHRSDPEIETVAKGIITGISCAVILLGIKAPFVGMKLAISHIAWPATEEEEFLRHIREWGCGGVEIAPSRVWPEPLDATPPERQAFKSLVYRYGLEIPAFQALFYNRPDLGVFRDRRTEAEAVKYLIGLCHLAADLGARVLVFGSPAIGSYFVSKPAYPVQSCSSGLRRP